MGEVQLRRIVRCGTPVASVHLVNRDAEPRMVVRRASVVEIAGVRRHSGAGQSEKGQELKHLQAATVVRPVQLEGLRQWDLYPLL